MVNQSTFKNLLLVKLKKNYESTMEDVTMFVYFVIFNTLATVTIATAPENVPANSLPATLSPNLKFDGKLFFKYIPSHTSTVNKDSNSSNNKIDFKFRTLHPSCLFVLLTGKQIIFDGSSKDVLTVELIHGYLRYSLSMFGHRESSLLVGNNLNDNRWHRVTIVRTKLLSEIRVDEHTKTFVSPAAYRRGSFNSIAYIGGYEPPKDRIRGFPRTTKINWGLESLHPKQYQPSVILLKRGKRRENEGTLSHIYTDRHVNRRKFKGCLQVLSVNGRHPIRYFEQGSKRVQVLPTGTKFDRCKEVSTGSIPGPPVSLDSTSIFHINHTLSNGLPEGKDQFFLRFSIRTFTETGTVLRVNNNNKNGDNGDDSITSDFKHFQKHDKIGIHLSLRSGKLVCSLWRHQYVANTASVMTTNWELTSQSRVSDGNWFDIVLKITRRDMSLKIDELLISEPLVSPSSSSSSQSLLSMKEVEALRQVIVFGGGFVGCMHNVRLHAHAQEMDGVENNKDLLNSNLVIKKNVRAGCHLNNHCFPNPCLNNGICIQHDYTDNVKIIDEANNKGNQWWCNCTSTEFHGPHCETSIYKGSCASYKQFGLSETSFCLVNPTNHGRGRGVGHLSSQPQTNLCRVLGKGLNKEVATVVKHDKEFYVDGLQGDTKFLNSIFHLYQYELDAESIHSLIRSSKTCRQRVSFRCRGTALFDPPNLSWLSSSNRERSYWGNVSLPVGAAPSTFPTCECGITRTCLDSSKMCNCDAMSGSWSEDSGYMTNKKDLPIRRVTLASNAVDYGAVNGEGRSSRIYIGPLECFGDIYDSNSEGINQAEDSDGSGQNARNAEFSDSASERSKTGSSELHPNSGSSYEAVSLATTTAKERRDLLSRVCISVRIKKRMLTIANDSLRNMRLYTEAPMLAKTRQPGDDREPYPTEYTDFGDSRGSGDSSRPLSSLTGPLSFRNYPVEEHNQGLSVHEIVLIAVAALAIAFLTVKFILCTLFRRLHGQVTLNHDRKSSTPDHNRSQQPNEHTHHHDQSTSSSLFYSTSSNGESSGGSSKRPYSAKDLTGGSATCSRGCIKSPKNYWV